MNGRPWTERDVALLCALYPNTKTETIAVRLNRPLSGTYGKAKKLGLSKTREFLASPEACRLRRGDNIGAAYRYPKGHVPANKGLRRPGWSRGRMSTHWFKKGGFPINRDPDFYVPGALRVNTDGYIDMRTSFELGSKGWTALHRILWMDANGPVPTGYRLFFKDGDRLNVELDNIGLRSNADHMRLNTVHNLPAPLKSAIHLLGQLKRRIREKQDRGSAQSPVRHIGGSPGQRSTDGDRAREGDRQRRPGSR